MEKNKTIEEWRVYGLNYCYLRAQDLLQHIANGGVPSNYGNDPTNRECFQMVCNEIRKDRDKNIIPMVNKLDRIKEILENENFYNDQKVELIKNIMED